MHTLSVISSVVDETEQIDSHLTNLEINIDERGSDEGIRLAVERLREALDELNEAIEEEESE